MEKCFGRFYSLHQHSIIILHSPINDYNFVATSNHATCSINRYAFYFVSQPIHHDTVALSHATESCMGIVAFRIVLQKKGPLLFVYDNIIQRDDGSVLSYIIERDGGVERVCS